MRTYDDLTKSISNFMGRDDLDAMIPDFIALAEGTLNTNAEFRVREMVCKLMVPLTGDELGLPPDYLGLRMLRYEKSIEIRPVSPRIFANSKLRNCNTPIYVDLGNRLEIHPQGANTPLELFYYQRIPALTPANQSNWLINVSYNAYLYGSLLEASEYVRDDDKIQLWATRYKDAIAGIVESDKRSRWSGPLRVAIE